VYIQNVCLHSVLTFQRFCSPACEGILVFHISVRELRVGSFRRLFVALPQGAVECTTSTTCDNSPTYIAGCSDIHPCQTILHNACAHRYKGPSGFPL
jgi:hypothetical protein